MNFCREGESTYDLRLRGIYPGRLNRSAGPDFQGAEFELDGRIFRGDVEIHTRTQEWFNHHHHLDKNYDNVLLHLVLDESGQTHVFNSQRREIETIGLRQFPSYSIPPATETQCDRIPRNYNQIEDVLKKMAMQRLKSKAINMRKKTETSCYDQVIFREFMYILGKPENEKNFYLLASLLPWESLMLIKERFRISKTEWLALFAIKSGLIIRVPEFFSLKKFKDRITVINSKECLKANLWHLSGQRPFNKPNHHLKILASWIYGFKSVSIYQSLKSILVQRSSFGKVLNELLLVFTIASKDYYRRDIELHIDTWGRSKLIEIVGNIIIPFFYWEAEEQNNFGFQSYLQSVYFHLPQTTKYKVLDSLYNLPPFKMIKFNRFYKNQGLMALKKYYCDLKDCQNCPFIGDHKEIDIIWENN
jgi:hypothetical protein